MVFSRECQLQMDAIFLDGGGQRAEKGSPLPLAPNSKASFGANSFTKKYRLQTRRDFSELAISSKKLQSRRIKVFYRKVEGRKMTRIGFAVSRRVGKAVIRNKIKRVLKEEFRCSPFKELGVDILVVVKTRRDVISFNDYICDIRQSLHYCLRKV